MFRNDMPMLNNQQYQNPMYQPYPSPYIPYGQIQSRQDPRQMYDVRGRWIQSKDEIMPKDLPDDGSVAIFPMRDYSKIVAKAWKSDGTIEEVIYLPEEGKKQPNAEQMIMETLKSHEQMLQKIMEMMGKAGGDNV